MVLKRAAVHRATGPSLFDVWVREAAADAAGSEAAASPPPGLSLVHPYSQGEGRKSSSAVLRIAENGHVVHLRRPRLSGPPRRTGRVRGKVNGLSRASAARCKRFLLSCDRSKVVRRLFEGTNTIPEGEFTVAEFKPFVKKWRDRFERKFPGVPVPWVEEVTEKGTLHLHFIVVWLRGAPRMGLKEFREWNDGAWAEVVRSSHPSHWKTGCTVNVIRTWERVVNYFSGYLAKGAGLQVEAAGRMWGCIGRKFFPASWVEVEVTDAERKEITRSLVRCRQAKRVVLVSTKTYSLRKRGVKTDGWCRLSARFNDAVRGSRREQVVMKGEKEDGWRLRIIRPRLYRRNAVKLFDRDEDSGKVERRYVEQKRLRRFCPIEGKKVDVWCDEIDSVAAAWHYLPAAEVLRLLGYVRRDAESGLTACEKRWARQKGVCEKRLVA